MALQKRKAVAANAGRVFKRSRAAKAEEEAEMEPEAEQEAEQEEQEEQEEQVEEEETVESKEEELEAARRKELKATPMDGVKRIAQDLGVEAKNKSDLVEAILRQEAEARAAARAHEARLREVVVRKKEELEALALPDLRARCAEAGIKGMLTKQARVELLLKVWQEADGVNKGLRQMLRDARERDLLAMEKASLRSVCERLGVAPYALEILAERVTRREGEAGRFARPVLEDDSKPEVAKASGKKAGDLVETLLASEATRKSEQERRRQEEEAVAKKVKELKAMSVEDLKKELARRGREASGKKDELVEALAGAYREEEAAASKRAKLRAMGLDDLKALVFSRGVEAPGKKEAMVEALMAHDVAQAANLRRFEEVVEEVLASQREELEAKTAAELKDLCVARELKPGLGKEDRMERLLQAARSGDVDRLAAARLREARRRELLGAGEAELLRLCAATGADPLVKEIMIERILTHEDEFGAEASTPAAGKKGRSAKN